MINVELAGHLGADPEVRFSPSGQKITTLRIATNIRRQGKDETVWWRAVIFGEHLDKIISYLKKGSGIIVYGRMNPPAIYNDKAGQPQVNLEIIATSIEFNPFGKSDRAEPGAGAAPYGQQQQHQSNRPMNLETPSFAAPSYSSTPSYEQPSQYSPQQAPFAHTTPHTSHSNAPNHLDQFPEEDNLPF